MTRTLILLAATNAIMIPLGIFLYWIVYDVLPEAVATHLGVGILCLSVGFLWGQRHGIER